MKGGIELNMRLLAAIIVFLIGVGIIIAVVLKILKPESYSNAGYEVCLILTSRLKFLFFSADVANICEGFRCC